jgi:hypothetical protein
MAPVMACPGFEMMQLGVDFPKQNKKRKTQLVVLSFALGSLIAL